MRPGPYATRPGRIEGAGTHDKTGGLRLSKPATPYHSPNRSLINREFALDPARQEAIEPGVHPGRVVDMALDVLVPLAGALHAEARVVVPGPAVHLGVGDLGVELQADGRA